MTASAGRDMTHNDRTHAFGTSLVADVTSADEVSMIESAAKQI